MTRLKIDKLMALLGSLLLGYYLALSQFRGLIWVDLLQRVLPPINNRHLPGFYVGLVGAAAGLFAGYLLFSRLVEKKTFKAHRKSYLLAAAFFVFALVLLAGSFRIHSVVLVNQAQSTAPAEIEVSFFDDPGSSIIFETCPNSGTGAHKRVVIDDADLEEIGKALREMEPVEILGRDHRFKSVSGSFTVTYRDRYFYSRIFAFGEGVFWEWVANNRIAVYRSEALARLLAKSIAAAADLEQYNQARILNSNNINAPEEQTVIDGRELRRLFGLIDEENKITPGAETVKRFRDIEKNPVPQSNTDFYAFQLYADPVRGNQNIMVYDSLTETLKYEGAYYRVDLSGFLK